MLCVRLQILNVVQRIGVCRSTASLTASILLIKILVLYNRTMTDDDKMLTVVNRSMHSLRSD